MAASPTERVLEGLTAWAQKASAGKVRWRSLVPTPVEPGEKVTAKVAQVAVVDIAADEADRGFDERAWKRGENPTTPGLVVATDRRLMLVGNGHKVKRQWRWEHVASMRMTSDLRAMLVQEAGVEDTLVAIIRQQFMLLSSPKGVEVATQLISLEGAWYLWQGKLDVWLNALPGRFPAG